MKKVDENFNEIVLRGVKTEISKAFINLEADLREGKIEGFNNWGQLEIFRRKAEQLKKEINACVDMHLSRAEELFNHIEN